MRGEIRRLETVYTTYGVTDLEKHYSLWRQNGGEVIRLSPAEQKRYVGEATSVLPAMLAADPKLKEDYDVIVAAARRQRK